MAFLACGLAGAELTVLPARQASPQIVGAEGPLRASEHTLSTNQIETGAALGARVRGAQALQALGVTLLAFISQ